MLTFSSPAKLNLLLKIERKRRDGYHELTTLNQAVNLLDTLSFSLSDVDHLISSDQTLSTGKDNLILQAVSLFKEKTGIKQGVSIKLEKNIPIESGLGGGSSNAATTLYALNQLFQTNLSDESLATLGATLGADVPFFFSCGTAKCRGIGEQVTNMPPLKEKKFWIFKPKKGLSTPLIYQRYRQEEKVPFDVENHLSLLMQGKSCYYNDLEESAVVLLPFLGRLKLDLFNQGFFDISMTGSGSAFFASQTNLLPKVENTDIYSVKTMNRSINQWY